MHVYSVYGKDQAELLSQNLRDGPWFERVNKYEIKCYYFNIFHFLRLAYSQSHPSTFYSISHFIL